jgi:hypothetical protein
VLAQGLGSAKISPSLTPDQSQARSVAEQDSAPRWVKLAAAAPATSYRWEFILEDLDQSRQALNRRHPPETI